MPISFSKEQRQQHVQAWRQSGLTQRAYCQQHRIKFGSFKNRSSDCLRQQPTCIPVVISPSESIREVTLQGAEKWQVKLSIAELITVLRALC